MFADKSTMGLAFEMAAVVLNSACASSSFSDMLLVGCFHYHVCEPPPIFDVAHMVCPRAPFAAPAAGGARAGLRNTGKIQNLPASHTKEAKKTSRQVEPETD